MKISVIKFLLAAMLAVSSLPLAAQTETSAELPDNVPSLLSAANSAYLAKDYLKFRQALEKLHEMRPNNGQYMYQLVIAHALLDEKTPAYDMMLHMQRQGLSYDFSELASTVNIKGTQVFTYINDMMKIAGEPLGESNTAFVLPASVGLPETIVWDESREKFLVGTIAEGRVIAVSKDGETTELLKANKENGMWAVMDILVDHARNRLWVSSAAIPVFAGYDPVDKGRSGLFEFDLQSLKFIRSHPVPVDGRTHVLGNMVLSPNGDIFVVDRAMPVFYRKPADEEKLKGFLALPDMISMRGAAIGPDGKYLYVADREMGIMVIDVKGSRAVSLAVPETLNVGGIDGLYLWNSHLIIIQNGTSPQRVMRLDLDAGGTRVTAVSPLAVAQPQFMSPSFGTINGNDLYYLADSQVEKDGKQARGVTVLRTPVDTTGELINAKEEAYLKQRALESKSKMKPADPDKS